MPVPLESLLNVHEGAAHINNKRMMQREHMMTQQASGGDPTQGINERANAEATTTTTYESEPPLPSSNNPSALPSNAGELLPGELWGTQGFVRDALRAAEAERCGLDPEASPPQMEKMREFFGTRYVMSECVKRSLERRGVEPFLVRMELQSIIRYVASLERNGQEWCAYYFPFMPEDVDLPTRPHLVRLAEQAGL
jgi:hypothetical protein